MYIIIHFQAKSPFYINSSASTTLSFRLSSLSKNSMISEISKTSKSINIPVILGANSLDLAILRTDGYNNSPNIDLFSSYLS